METQFSLFPCSVQNVKCKIVCFIFLIKKIIVVLKEESQIMKIKSVFHEKENKLFRGLHFFLHHWFMLLNENEDNDF